MRREDRAWKRVAVLLGLSLRYRPLLRIIRLIVRQTAKSRRPRVARMGELIRVALDPLVIRRYWRRGLSQKYVRVRGVVGEYLQIDINDHVGWRTFLDGVFDPVPVILADLICDKTLVFVDVGANVGTTSIPVAFLGHEVIGIEPAPDTLGSLARNVHLNSPIPYTMVSMAVGPPEAAAGNRFVTLYTQRGNSGATSLLSGWNATRGPTSVAKARVTSVDSLLDFLRPAGVGLVKIDAEGFEQQVLRGMDRLLKSVKPPVLFEWRPDITARAGLDQPDIRELFPEGYSFFGVNHTPEAQPASTFRVTLSDFDLELPFENVLALVVPPDPGPMARLVAERGVAYRLSRGEAGPQW